MVFRKAAAPKSGFYKGKPADPDTVKFEVDFQGIPVKVDRPSGFTMSGVDSKGVPWERTYKYDYGFIPKTLGGDDDGLDVFLGPNKDAKTAFWVTQHHPDGSFDEYKVFLGFDTEAEAKKAYKQHIPAAHMGEVSAMTVEMMKAMLGDVNPEAEKRAMWGAFFSELLEIGRAL